MPEQGLLDLGTGDVVAGRDDHVVGAGLVVEVAVAVADVDVAGDVPSILHVGGLAVASQVAAPGWALHREPPQLAVGHRPALRILDLGHVARHCAPGAPRPNLVALCGDEDVKHLRRADAIDDAYAACVMDRIPCRLRERLAG